jgi:hypothetical protein
MSVSTVSIEQPASAAFRRAHASIFELMSVARTRSNRPVFASFTATCPVPDPDVEHRPARQAVAEDLLELGDHPRVDSAS